MKKIEKPSSEKIFCHFCYREAVIDAPTIHREVWAYMCKQCSILQSTPLRLEIGFTWEEE